MSSGRIDSCTLRNGDLSVTILSLGCITQSWRLERDAGTEMILGYTDPAAYLTDPFYLGAIVGRVANRISGARFALNNREYHLNANEPPNTLHGGKDGLSRQFWSMERDGDARVRLSHLSADGAGGFPCTVRLEVTISLSENSLAYEMAACPDGETPINLAQHNYYSLGSGGVSDNELSVASARYTCRGDGGIPTGEIASVSGGPLDFHSSRRVPPETDDNFVLDSPDLAARLTAKNGLSMEIKTTEPCLQVYAGAGLGYHAPALVGSIQPGSGVALEPQRHPDALNRPEFPSILCTPDEPYYQRTVLELIERPFQ